MAGGAALAVLFSPVVEDSTGTDRPESWAFTVHVPRPFASKHVARYKQLAPPAVPVRGHGPTPPPAIWHRRISISSSRRVCRAAEVCETLRLASLSRAGPTNARTPTPAGLPAGAHPVNAGHRRHVGRPGLRQLALPGYPNRHIDRRRNETPSPD